MRIKLELEFSADGDETPDYQLDSLKELLDEINSAAVSLTILKVEVVSHD